MGRKSQVRQQRRAAQRNYGNSSPLYSSDRGCAVRLPERREPASRQKLIFAVMANKALHCPEPGVVWKASLPGGFASVEFKSIADISQEGYEGIHDLVSDVDFGTHRVLAWENKANPGEMSFSAVSLEKLAEMASLGQ